MAIVFASISGIAGREAISNFVHRFMVPRSSTYSKGGCKASGGYVRSGSGPGDVVMENREGSQEKPNNISVVKTTEVMVERDSV